MIDDHNPYQVFIEVLSFRHATTHQIALTGEMIAAYAEMNHMLGRSKGFIARDVWADSASEVDRCVDLYRSAWVKSNPHLVGEPKAPLFPGASLTPSFQLSHP